MRKRSRLVAALVAAFVGHRKGLIMHKKFAAIVLATALVLGGTVACSAPADAATISQPSYVGYLVGSQRCGN